MFREKKYIDTSSATYKQHSLGGEREVKRHTNTTKIIIDRFTLLFSKPK